MSEHALQYVVPRPKTVEMKDGSFQLSPGSRICWTGAAAEGVAELLAETLRPATGYDLPVIRADAPAEGDILLLQTGDPAADEAGFYPEAYTCDASPTGVRIEAPAAAGLARGIQTLRQLLPPEIYADEVQDASWALPCLHIEDAPRFRWRGLHLDVSRHFFTVEEICRFIELLAIHRLNILHLHLTDDQGWRIEIKQYPKLTEIGSVRSQTLIGHGRARPRRYDGQPYGGFLTQDDIRTIVAFAARRHITIVPEIDMPGHMQAAIAAYPELGNTDQTIQPRCHWGISQHILNVEDATVVFMKNVLDEVMELFPGLFIHVGGDEALKHEWSESPAAQRRMAELGLSSEDELQSWFIGQMAKHIASCGRRMIGWDEILEGGLAEGAALMSWRSEEGGIIAAGMGHDVVMAPNLRLYFDRPQAEPFAEEPLAIGGLIYADQVYAYEPIPQKLAPEHHRHVLGAQGQLWTEYISSMEYLEYMAYPRTCALAETLWLPPQEKNRTDFLRRLQHHRRRLATLNVNAHPCP